MENVNKIDGTLGLALNLSEDELQESEQLNSGYDAAQKKWKVIVKYYGNLESVRSSIPDIQIVELFNQYAIVTLSASELSTLAQQPEIIYIEKPRDVYFNLDNGRGVSCIDSLQRSYEVDIPESVQSTSQPDLTGRGVLIGIVDSGIDYTHPGFRNADGTTRIRYIWDQTIENVIGRTPAGYAGGAEYSAADINEALQIDNRAFREKMVPVNDRGSGHGTAVAGVAAGNGLGSAGRRYRGVAVDSELIVVKLGNSGSGFPRTTEVMEGIDYIVRKAIELQMPVAINLSFGSNEGAHNGESLFENYITDMNGIWKNVIVVASGNEGDARHHAHVSLSNATNGSVTVSIAIAENERDVSLQLWKSYQDEFEIILRSPGGTQVQISNTPDVAEEYMLSNNKMLVFVGSPTPYTISQGIFVQWLSGSANTISPGIWTLELKPVSIVYGEVDMWLPTVEAIGLSTGFLNPSSDTTLTIPSTSRKIITVGAYSALTDNYASFSGRGDTADGRYMPTVVAPGVGVVTVVAGGSYGPKTGTSIAAPFVTGAAALLMEWGIVNNNDPYLYGEKIKAYMIKGARKLSGVTVYPSKQVGWGALCVRESLPV